MYMQEYSTAAIYIHLYEWNTEEIIFNDSVFHSTHYFTEF